MLLQSKAETNFGKVYTLEGLIKYFEKGVQ